MAQKAGISRPEAGALLPAELRAHRQALRMTQAALAVALGVTATTVARWERGEQVIGHPRVVRLALDRLEQRSNRPRRSPRRPPSVSTVRLPEPVQVRGHNLPAQVSTFVGRERQLGDVKRLLERTRLLTVTGTGGVGKTRLALQAAADLVGEYADGAWFVEFASIAEPADVARGVAAVLHVVEQANQPLVDTLSNVLTNRCLLLVLDNCEHVLQPCAEFAQVLLGQCRSVRILTTSRERLGLAGEVVLQLTAMELPAAVAEPSPTRAVQTESVRLFVERATDVLPGFGLNNDNWADVANLCRQLEGIPLALELAAARIHALSVKQIAARLDDRLGLLVSTTRTPPRRHQTVRAAVEWSYELLSAAEQRLFSRVSVFVRDWTLEAAEAVVADPARSSPTVLDLLSQLVTKSLVIAESTPDGHVRYRQLELVRQYANERLSESGEAGEIQAQHAYYYLALAAAEQPEPGVLENIPGLDRLNADRANLLFALQWFVERVDLDGAQLLASALWPFWYVSGYLEEGWRWINRVLALPGVNSPNVPRAKVLFGTAMLAYRRGDYDTSEAVARECLRLSRELGQKVLVAAMLRNLGTLARMRHRFSESRRLLNGAVSVARAAGCRAEEIEGLLQLARLDYLEADHDAARTRFEKALAIASETRNSGGIVGALRGLGEVAYKCGDHLVARTLLEECAERARAPG